MNRPVFFCFLLLANLMWPVSSFAADIVLDCKVRAENLKTESEKDAGNATVEISFSKGDVSLLIAQLGHLSHNEIASVDETNILFSSPDGVFRGMIDRTTGDVAFTDAKTMSLWMKCTRKSKLF
jgi:hypothetical protein